jgi:hypothetical protein
MTIYRQGDVLLVAINSIPANARTEVARDNGRIVLAYGEVTGHAHAIHDTEAVLLAAPDTEDRFLRIMATVALEHEEHATIMLPPGDYITRRQREYTSADMAPIRVAD